MEELAQVSSQVFLVLATTYRYNIYSWVEFKQLTERVSLQLICIYVCLQHACYSQGVWAYLLRLNLELAHNMEALLTVRNEAVNPLLAVQATCTVTNASKLPFMKGGSFLDQPPVQIQFPFHADSQSYSYYQLHILILQVAIQL